MFNKEAVQSLAHSNPTASAVFLALSQRERNRRIVNIDLMKSHLEASGVAIDPKAYFDVFKRLDELQVGSLVYGRKGNPNTFEWAYALTSVTEVALGGKDIEIKALAEKSKPAAREIKRRGTRQKYVTFRIPLSMIKGLKG